MNSISNRNKVFRIVIGVVILITCVVIGMATTVVIQASGGSPLPDYISKDTSKTLGTSENPYTILEIVPDVNSSTVGYLINGCEPNNLLAIGATDSATSIYEGAFATDKSPTSTVGDKKDAYVYKQDQSSIGTTPSSGFMEKSDTYKGPGQPGTDMAYSEFGYFTRVTNGTGNYNYNSSKKCFVPANDGNFSWTCVGEFQYVGYGNVPNGSIACSRALDFGLGGERKFSYDYSSNTGAIGSDAYNYYYTPTGDFTWVSNNNYNNENIFMENQTEITYVEDDKTKTRPITSAKVGDKLYMTRTENVYYMYKASAITVNDLLLKELVTPDTTGLNYKTQVVTVTPAQLVVDNSGSGEDIKAKDLIDTADAIIIHDCETGYKIAQSLGNAPAGDVPKFNNNVSRDLTTRTVNYMIARGAGASPAAIMFDEEAIKSANTYTTASQNCPNLKLVYDVYNNLGAKLAYNWMSGQSYASKLNAASQDTEHYRNFNFEEKDALGRSHFVYNFEGTDDSWLTTGFANNSKIASSDLNQPAFYNVNASGTMSVAKMLSAINKETNGYNQPKKLRILEIQPNEKYYYNPSAEDSKKPLESWVYRYANLFPWFIGTGTDLSSDLTITTMPTWEFIGRNEDPNETYDLILIGNKEQDETNGGPSITMGFNKGGYNDPGLQPELNGEPSPLSYTAVGDLITTYGYQYGYPVDESKEAEIEDKDNPDATYYLAYRTNTDKVDVSSSQYSYKWKYGLFKNSKWYNTRNVYALNGDSYNIGFSQRYVKGLVGGGDWIWSWRISEWIWMYHRNHNNYVYGTKHGSDANMVGLRYSGNDLTKKKYDQLIDFSKQAPLIISDDLYEGETANENKIDKSSFVYKLANKNTDKNSTVHKYSNGVKEELQANKVKEEMIADTVSATFTDTADNKPGIPTEYNSESGINYNTQTDNAGNTILSYHFVLNGNDKSTYGINLYTDSNGNGIFEGCINHENEWNSNGVASGDSERASSLVIFDEKDKVYINYSREKNEDGTFTDNYALQNDHPYLVYKIMPPSDVGMVPWKLEIYKQGKGNQSVRFSKEGYTRIKPSSGKKTTIHVLQMNPSLEMNVDYYKNDESINFANNKLYTLDGYDVSKDPLENYKTITNNDMSSFYNIEDFDIKVDYMTNTYWSYVYGENRRDWNSDLMNYDMLIIGFKDSASFTNNVKFIDGFEKFREKEKSIILSHDLVSDTTVDGIMDERHSKLALYPAEESVVLQSDVKYYLREISGQMRKYYNAASDSNDYSYMNYYSNGRPLSFEPSDYFKIFTSVEESFNDPGTWNNVEVLKPNEGDSVTPIYDKYVYTYGVFNDNKYVENNIYGYTYTIQKTKKPIRDYYAANPNKPANIIMDNSNRAMLYYNYINYDRDNSPNYGDRVDRYLPSKYAERKNLTWRNPANTTKVTAVNEGQITKYPYEIPDTLDVATTHTQNYQLDLEYDNEGDVLVWYDLTGGTSNMYSAREKDSRNHYYIYTKGNITYTGVGDGEALTDMEKKLFVNTMVASYRSSASDPYITITNQDAVRNGKTTTIYLEDRGDGGNNIDINYRINDDTSNSKIDRGYLVHIYKDGEWQEVIDAEKATDYKIENVSYSEVKANGQVQYVLYLVSKYTNDQGIDVYAYDTQTVNVVLMPMFGLR